MGRSKRKEVLTLRMNHMPPRSKFDSDRLCMIRQLLASLSGWLPKEVTITRITDEAEEKKGPELK